MPEVNFWFDGKGRYHGCARGETRDRYNSWRSPRCQKRWCQTAPAARVIDAGVVCRANPASRPPRHCAS